MPRGYLKHHDRSVGTKVARGGSSRKPGQQSGKSKRRRNKLSLINEYDVKYWSDEDAYFTGDEEDDIPTGNKRRGNISNENREERTEIVQRHSEGCASIAISEDLSYSLCDDHEEDFTIVSSPWEADLESDFESLVFVSQTIEPELTLPTRAMDAKTPECEK